MNINKIKEAVAEICESIGSTTRKPLECHVSDLIDSAVFPDQCEKEIGQDRNGLYVFSGKSDGEIHYIGISNDVVGRFYKHIGSGFNWSRDGRVAKFPHCAIVGGRDWLDPQVRELFRNAEFNVTFVIPSIKESKELLEQYLIYYSWAGGKKTSINVMKIG